MNQSYADSLGHPRLPKTPLTFRQAWAGALLVLLVSLTLLPAPGARAATGPLVFEGGEPGVQHRPKVHLILWGGKSYWEGAEGVAIRQSLEGFYQALSGSSWTGILTQYYDYATHPSSTIATAPTYISTYNPSAIVDYNTIPEIVRDAIKAQKATKTWGEVTRDSQYVVVGALGAAYYQSFLQNACAWHSWGDLEGSGSPKFNFTFLFNYKAANIYEKCKMYNSDPTRILTTLASHEFAESVTDPLPTGSGVIKRGWVSHDPAPGGHTISDVCTGTENVGQPGPNGYYVTPIWDNWKGGCQTADSNPPFPSPEQPHPLVQANGKVNLFWRGATGALDYSSSEDGGETWSDVIRFSSLGQPTAGQPSAVEPSPGKISVFWKSGQEDSGVVECFGSTDGYLREMEYNGSTWSSKIPCVGSKQPIGPLGGAPVAVAQSNGTVNVFWRGTDNALWYASRAGGVWTTPTSVGGSLASNPSVARAGSDILHFFWRAPGNILQHRTYNETTKTWSATDTAAGAMGTASYEAPTALARAGGAVEAVWPSSFGSMRRARYNGFFWTIDSIAAGPTSPNPQFSAAAVPVGAGDAQLWYTGNDGMLWTSTYSNQTGSWSGSSIFASGGTAVGTQPQAAISPSGNATVYWMDPNIEGAYAAWNKGGWHGPTLVSPMEPIAPTAKTGPPSDGGETFVSLRGTIHPGRTTTTYYFEYGPTTTYGSSTAKFTQSGSFPHEIGIPLSGLTPATTYHYRLVAENDVGKSVGSDEIFTSGWNLKSVEGSKLEAVSCISSSNCTAVGSVGADPAVRRWNGVEWKAEGTQEPEGGSAQESTLTGVSCTSASFCMAVGYYKSAAGKFMTWAERWNGSGWELVSTENKAAGGEVFNFLDGVSCFSPGQCVAVGHYLTRTAPGESEVTKAIGEYSTGGNFTLQELPVLGGSTQSELKGISCYAPWECTAVGYYNSGPGQWRPLEGQWYGPLGWTAASPPLPAEAANGWLSGVSCPAPDYCQAAGFYMTPSQEVRSLAERRNGPKSTTWTSQTPPNPAGSSSTYLYGVSCAGKDSCVAVGHYSGSPVGARALAESWDGSTWKAQYPFNSKEAKVYGALDLSGISCPRRGACSAVGFFLNQAASLSAFANTYSIKVPATVVTTGATSVKSTEATLNGTINPNGAKSTTYYFEYGPTASYGSSTPPAETGTGESAIPVSAAIGGLTPSATYHFRLVASNGTGGQQVGEDKAFTTDTASNPPPQIVTLPVPSPTSPLKGVVESTTNGTWTGEPIKYAYQWQRCNLSGGECSSIAGATSSTYTPVEADVSHTLVVTVTAENSGGATSASSKPTNEVRYSGQITEYPLPANSQPIGITAGPDGNLWYTDCGTNKIGKMTITGSTTEYPNTEGSCPIAVTQGPDSNLWFALASGIRIGKISTSGTTTYYSISGTGANMANGRGIATGPDNNLWVTATEGKIAKVTTAGVVTRYTITSGAPGSAPHGITPGPDGKMWFAENGTNKIAKITTSGELTEYPLPSAALPYGIVTGPDGNLWFGAWGKVGKVTTSGAVTEYSLPTATEVKGITRGPDGNLWFAYYGTDKIGKITPSGTVTTYSLPAGSKPWNVAVGPDGNIWFTDYGTHKIGKVTP